ncbi:MAG: hypothetical protein OXD30_11075 [Bryobacterales bacterium]|nr:hypothetical protein [Bryobacterales bacterium]
MHVATARPPVPNAELQYCGLPLSVRDTDTATPGPQGRRPARPCVVDPARTLRLRATGVFRRERETAWIRGGTEPGEQVPASPPEAPAGGMPGRVESDLPDGGS